jgi:hypothetical protein
MVARAPSMRGTWAGEPPHAIGKKSTEPLELPERQHGGVVEVLKPKREQRRLATTCPCQRRRGRGRSISPTGPKTIRQIYTADAADHYEVDPNLERR